MEFDFGTLLYIVVTIIALIASVVGKKKKPEAPQSTDNEEVRQERGFFGRLDEQFGSFMEEAKESANNLKEKATAASDEFVFSSDRADQEDDEEIANAERFDDETADSGSAYADFEGVLNPEKQANVDQIKADAEKSSKHDEVLDVIEIDDVYNPDYFEIVKDFDLGTAVIYSTIINRKEY